MATYAHGSDTVTITAGTILAPTAVSLNQNFYGNATDTTDDYRLAIKINGTPIIDASMGPHTIIDDTEGGARYIQLSGGVGGNFAGSDIVLLKKNDGSGEQAYNEVHSHVGGDLIALKERITIDLKGGVSTFEVVPRVEIVGVEGVGSGGTRNFVEDIWFTDLERRKGWFFTRHRLDRNTTFALRTRDFTLSGGANTIAVYDRIDETNIHRADRRTSRALMSATATAPQSQVGLSESFLSWGSGCRDSVQSFGNTIARYAEQHPPVRLYVDITAGSNFTTPVVIYGFRTVWSPIRDTISVGANSVRISPENYSQFAIGDQLTLFSLSSLTWETIQITGKTAPDILNLGSTTSGAYAVDDPCGIWQSENVSVSGGVGQYYTTDSWVYSLAHSAAAPGDYTYQVYSAARGFTGAIHSADCRQQSGVYNTLTARQREAVVQVTVGEIEVGDGVIPTVFGGCGGAMIAPRDTDLIISAANDSVAWFGHIDKFSNVTSPQLIMRGSHTAQHALWTIEPDATCGVVGAGLIVMNRRMCYASDGGKNSVGDPAFWRMWESIGASRHIFEQGTTDVYAYDVRSLVETANDTITGGSGSAFSVNAPNELEDYQIVKSVNGYDRGVYFFVGAGQTTPMRIREYNANIENAAGRSSAMASVAGAAGNNGTARCIDSFVTIKQIGTCLTSTKLLESAFTMSVNVVNEAGLPVENIRIYLTDKDENIVFNVLTDVFGSIPLQEIVSHRATKTNTGSTHTWYVGDSTPGGVTEKALGPFLLTVVPDQAAGTEGYVPFHAIVDATEHFPNPKRFLLVVEASRVIGGPIGVY